MQVLETVRLASSGEYDSVWRTIHPQELLHLKQKPLCHIPNIFREVWSCIIATFSESATNSRRIWYYR